MNVTYHGWTYRLSPEDKVQLEKATSPADVQKILGRAPIVSRSRRAA